MQHKLTYCHSCAGDGIEISSSLDELENGMNGDEGVSGTHESEGENLLKMRYICKFCLVKHWSFGTCIYLQELGGQKIPAGMDSLIGKLYGLLMLLPTLP